MLEVPSKGLVMCNVLFSGGPLLPLYQLSMHMEENLFMSKQTFER